MFVQTLLRNRKNPYERLTENITLKDKQKLKQTNKQNKKHKRNLIIDKQFSFREDRSRVANLNLYDVSEALQEIYSGLFRL